MYFKKKIVLLFFIVLNFSVVSAQLRRGQSAASGSNDSQTSSYIFSGYDLTNFDAGQLSDANISTIKSRLQERGVSFDQAEQMAVSQGMPAAQASKLKARLAGTTGTSQQAAPAAAKVDTMISAPRTTEADSYLTYQKPKDNLDIFGSSFFNTPSLSFEPNLRIATPSNYTLGPDDELLITVSGYQEVAVRAKVQPEGTIFLPQVGPITVAGLTIEQATALLRSKMSKTVYKTLKSGLSTLSISLSKIKSIRVTVVGAAKPGNYTVSSLATVFNILYMCGGPGDINTYRNIELIRNNKVQQTIDLYQFLAKGDQWGNVPLKEGDVIYFPVYSKHVTVKGQVKRPGIFELKSEETAQDLFLFAGGYTERAYKAMVKVWQITDTARQVHDIPKSEINSYKPLNGDEFLVDSVMNRSINGVAISGAVHRPGEFELTAGLTIKKLIERAGGLVENAFTQRANLIRRHTDGTKENFSFNVSSVMEGNGDLALIKGDAVQIAFSSALKSDYQINIVGEVRKPGQYGFRQNLSLKDALLMAGGVTDAASSFNIEVGRRIVDQSLHVNVDSIAKVYNLDIHNGLDIDNSNFILEPFDIITVRQNPGYSVQKTVFIKGEVNFPGSYTIATKNERVSSLIKRAGGLSPFANKEGVFLLRNSKTEIPSKNQSVKSIEESTDDKTGDKVIDDVNRTNDHIAINFNKVLKNPGSTGDYLAQDGDTIAVLKLDPLVKVSGQVLASTKTGFVKGKSMSYYLTQAGGLTDDAKRSKIYVVYSNGSVNRTHNILFGIFKSYPRIDEGSEIIVPGKKDRKPLSTTEVLGVSSTFVSLISLIIITINALKK